MEPWSIRGFLGSSLIAAPAERRVPRTLFVPKVSLALGYGGVFPKEPQMGTARFDGRDYLVSAGRPRTWKDLSRTFWLHGCWILTTGML
jgi:hypothetical protein